MIGLAILNDLMDPAVHGSPDTVRWFVGGAAALVLGLAWLLGLTLGERPT